MRSVIAIILIVGFSVVAYADEPSFDCSKATAAVEVKICNNDYLSELDSLLAYNYKNAPWSEWDENGKKTFKSEQKAWMVKRNACGDENCLADAYKSRIDEICAIPAASGVNDCQPWEKLGLDVDVASQAKEPVQQPVQQASEPPYKMMVMDGDPNGRYISDRYPKLVIVATVNGVIIENVTMNEGACAEQYTNPHKGEMRKSKMGRDIKLSLMNCNPIKVDVVTDRGSWSHSF